MFQRTAAFHFISNFKPSYSVWFGIMLHFCRYTYNVVFILPLLPSSLSLSFSLSLSCVCVCVCVFSPVEQGRASLRNEMPYSQTSKCMEVWQIELTNAHHFRWRYGLKGEGDERRGRRGGGEGKGRRGVSHAHVRSYRCLSFIVHIQLHCLPDPFCRRSYIKCDITSITLHLISSYFYILYILCQRLT